MLQPFAGGLESPIENGRPMATPTRFTSMPATARFAIRNPQIIFSRSSGSDRIFLLITWRGPARFSLRFAAPAANLSRFLKLLKDVLFFLL